MDIKDRKYYYQRRARIRLNFLWNVPGYNRYKGKFDLFTIFIYLLRCEGTEIFSR